MNADEMFEKLHYTKMIENWEDAINIIYKINYCNKNGLKDRLIIFSNQVGLYINNRKNENIFLTKDEIQAIILKINELEKEGWYFK